MSYSGRRPASDTPHKGVPFGGALIPVSNDLFKLGTVISCRRQKIGVQYGDI